MIRNFNSTFTYFTNLPPRMHREEKERDKFLFESQKFGDILIKQWYRTCPVGKPEQSNGTFFVGLFKDETNDW